MKTARELLTPLLVLCLVITSPACALLSPNKPSDDAEITRRLELLDNHLEEARAGAELRRQIVAGATVGSGIALVGVGMYVRTLEGEITCTLSDPPMCEEENNGLSSSLFIMGGVTAVVGAILWFVPTAEEAAVARYTKKRAADDQPLEGQLYFGEKVLQATALSNLHQRLKWGLPMLLGGALLVGAATAGSGGESVDDPSTELITALGSIGILTAVGGGVITFTPTAAEAGWSDYKDQVEGMQSGGAAIRLDLAPTVFEGGGGMIGRLVF